MKRLAISAFLVCGAFVSAFAQAQQAVAAAPSKAAGEPIIAGVGVNPIKPSGRTDHWHIVLGRGASDGDSGGPTAVDAVPAACPADADRSGTVDNIDVLVFIIAFETQDRAADTDRDGRVDLLDLFAFFAAFESGC